MRLVLLGPPGAGKGTQADLLSKEFDIPQISTGDILRETVRDKTEVGKEAKAYMDKGELVPDDLVTQIVIERLSRPDAAKGFILDGYPRTKSQAESLKMALNSKGITIDRVLYFRTSEDKIISRLSGRRVCPSCNAIYHIKKNPPRKNNICDKCGSTLYQRQDDKVRTVKKRLKVYKKTEDTLMQYYKKEGLLKEVSGDLDAKELFCSLKDFLKGERAGDLA